MTPCNDSGRVFTIWVCPDCGYYDADPVLRRGPNTRHGPMRCFACGDQAVKALDMGRINPSWRATRAHAARDAAPLMVATRVAAALPGTEAAS